MALIKKLIIILFHREFVKIVESEVFYCHPVKYSYCELVSAISDVTLGDLAERFKTKGVSISFAYIDDYRNKVVVGLESQEDYDAVINELDSDIYSISITDGGFHDATNYDLYPGEGVVSEAVPFSVACRVKRNYPDGTSTDGILTCAHAFSGTQTVYLNFANLIGISYSFNQHNSGNADVAFIDTYSNVNLHNIVNSSQITLYSIYATSYNQGAVVYMKGSATNGISGGYILNSSFSCTVNNTVFTDLVSASYACTSGDSGGIIFTPSNNANYAYPAGINKGYYTSGSDQYGAFTKLYNGLAALQSGPITHGITLKPDDVYEVVEVS